MKSFYTYLALLAIAFAGIAQAEDRAAPIVSGQVAVHLGSDNTNPDRLAVASIAVRRADTLVNVFCQDIDAAGEVQGLTDPLAATPSSAIILEGIAFSGPGCTGEFSEATIDRYRVVFGSPNRPVLLPVLP